MNQKLISDVLTALVGIKTAYSLSGDTMTVQCNHDTPRLSYDNKTVVSLTCLGVIDAEPQFVVMVLLPSGEVLGDGNVFSFPTALARFALLVKLVKNGESLTK